MGAQVADLKQASCGVHLFDDRSVADAPGMRFARAAFQVGHEALVRLVVEPGELGERIDVVVDTQIEIGYSSVE